MTDILQSYESTPYQTLPHWQTHPDSLAAVSLLAGLTPADPHHCRVLELGCATGGNLIPLACAFPQSQFLGIDLAPSQIETADRIINAMNLPNIAFRAMNLLDADKDLGTFDYILCHGVFSWVPDVVRDKILWIIQNLLNPNGAAFISYNAYPGWHLRSIARDLMVFHANRFEGADEKLAQVRDFMKTLDKTVCDRESVYGRILSDEARAFAKADEFYLVHEHLDPINQPYYFHQFTALLQKFNLRWIGEVPLQHSHLGRYSKAMEDILLQCPPDPLLREQYIDFLTNRIFHCSAITHQREDGSVRWDMTLLERLQFSAELNWTEKPDGVVDFGAVNGRKISTKHPDMIRMLKFLANAWPYPVPFAQIPADESARREMVQECLFNSILRIHYRPYVLKTLSEKPRAFEYARLQAQDGLEMVVNLKHYSVPLPAFDALVLTHCNGERTANQIADQLWQKVQQGDFEMSQGDSEQDKRSVLLSQVNLSLSRLFRASLLAE